MITHLVVHVQHHAGLQHRAHKFFQDNLHRIVQMNSISRLDRVTNFSNHTF